MWRKRPGAPGRSSGRWVLPLDHSNHQGKYGEAFVRVLAAAAGLTVAVPDPDYDGVDFFLGYPGARGTKYRPGIDVQVKSWRSPEGTATHWRYRLTAGHFNELAGYFDTPRFLFLVVVPNDLGLYAAADPDCLRLRHAGYWTSLQDVEPMWHLPSDKKVSVSVPKENLLTVESLLTLMTRPDAQVEVS